MADISDTETATRSAGPPTGGRLLHISESAAKRIAALREKKGDPDLKLRISVSGGGCSGFQYGFDFDKEITGDDRVFTRDDVFVVIDEVSLEFLNGAELDFVEDMMGAMFVINNPNAESSCGCGSSFSVKM